MAFILKIIIAFLHLCASVNLSFQEISYMHYMFLFQTCVVMLSHETVYLLKVIRYVQLMDSSNMESPPAYLLNWSSCWWGDSVRKSVVSKGMPKNLSFVRILALNDNRVRAVRKSTHGLVLCGNHIEKRIYSNVMLSLRNVTFLPSPQSR